MKVTYCQDSIPTLTYLDTEVSFSFDEDDIDVVSIILDKKEFGKQFAIHFDKKTFLEFARKVYAISAQIELLLGAKDG